MYLCKFLMEMDHEHSHIFDETFVLYIWTECEGLRLHVTVIKYWKSVLVEILHRTTPLNFTFADLLFLLASLCRLMLSFWLAGSFQEILWYFLNSFSAFKVAFFKRFPCQTSTCLSCIHMSRQYFVSCINCDAHCMISLSSHLFYFS